MWTFAHLPLGLSSHNKMVLWPGCEGGVRCNLHKKNVRSVRFIAKRRGCCCKLSVGIALKVRFTTKGMYAKTNTQIYVTRTSNNRVISSGYLYCCLLPQCEALHICCSSFPIATQEMYETYFLVFRIPQYTKITREKQVDYLHMDLNLATFQDISVTRRPIDASIQRVYLLGFKELSFNILETRK